MVERFDAYYDSISCKSTGRHIHADGEFVLASDFAALEAELARVKAESLRVVAVDKEDLGHYEVAMAVILNHAATIYERYDSQGGKLVRLERWEDEG